MRVPTKLGGVMLSGPGALWGFRISQLYLCFANVPFTPQIVLRFVPAASAVAV